MTDAVVEVYPGGPYRRLNSCIAEWPACAEGEYDPHCCRWPKSCSCTVYDKTTVKEEDLEPTFTMPEPKSRIVSMRPGATHRPLAFQTLPRFGVIGQIWVRTESGDWLRNDGYSISDDDFRMLAIPMQIIQLFGKPEPRA